MKRKDLLKIMRLMFSNPEHVWIKLKADNYSKKSIIANTVVPILIIVSIADFIGRIQTYELVKAIVYSSSLLLTHFSIFLLSVAIMKYLAKYLKSSFYKDSAYSSTLVCFLPYWSILLITGLFPVLNQITFLSVYGLVLLWIGLRIIVGMDLSQRVTFIIVYSILIILMNYSFQAIVFKTLGLLY